MRLTPDWDPIAEGETDVFGYDAAALLGPNETVASFTFSIDTFAGSDAQAASRLIGAPTQNGTVLSQTVGGCVGGVTYDLKVSVTTSIGKVRVGWCYLPCVRVP